MARKSHFSLRGGSMNAPGLILGVPRARSPPLLPMARTSRFGWGQLLLARGKYECPWANPWPGRPRGRGTRGRDPSRNPIQTMVCVWEPWWRAERFAPMSDSLVQPRFRPPPGGGRNLTDQNSGKLTLWGNNSLFRRASCIFAPVYEYFLIRRSFHPHVCASALCIKSICFLTDFCSASAPLSQQSSFFVLCLHGNEHRSCGNPTNQIEFLVSHVLRERKKVEEYFSCSDRKHFVGTRTRRDVCDVDIKVCAHVFSLHKYINLWIYKI